MHERCLSTHADLAVELAVCSLLLGDSEKAEDILGLAPDAASGQADPAVKSFVMVCFHRQGTSSLSWYGHDDVIQYETASVNAAEAGAAHSWSNER